jgi:hypothetical protein
MFIFHQEAHALALLNIVLFPPFYKPNSLFLVGGYYEASMSTLETYVEVTCTFRVPREMSNLNTKTRSENFIQ